MLLYYNKLTIKELAEVKAKMKLINCHKWCHWSFGYNSDYSFKWSIVTIHLDQKAQAIHKDSSKNPVTFQMAILTSFNSDFGSNELSESLLDDRAPYDAIVHYELELLSSTCERSGTEN